MMHDWVRISLEIQQAEMQIDALHAARAKLKQQQKQLYQDILYEAAATGRTFEEIAGKGCGHVSKPDEG